LGGGKVILNGDALTLGELFAGVGGISSGFIRAGFKLKWCCEWDKNCQHVLRRHNSGVPIYGDITQLDPSTLEHVDVISYSFPCQDVSVAGKRKGMVNEDGTNTRSGLFYEALRIISGVRPRICIAENVPGLLSAENGNSFFNCLCGLADIGYSNTVWTTLDSQYFSVAQRRRRVFIISSREVEPNLAKECLAEIYLKPKSLPRNFAESEKTK
jgi:DNA (cytosine-5)-methyltransferase 1